MENKSIKYIEKRRKTTKESKMREFKKQGSQLSVLTLLFIIKNEDENLVLKEQINERKNWYGHFFLPENINLQDILLLARNHFKKDYDLINNITKAKKTLLNFYFLHELNLLDMICSTQRNLNCRHFPFFNINYIHLFQTYIDNNFNKLEEFSKLILDNCRNFKLSSFNAFKAIEIKNILLSHMTIENLNKLKQFEYDKLKPSSPFSNIIKTTNNNKNDLKSWYLGSDENGPFIDLNADFSFDDLDLNENDNSITVDEN